MSNQILQNFKYDIAISLCKEYVDFAEKLVKAINPNLKVFFYKHRQEELIGQSAPDIFAKVFKEESRIAVILSSEQWGKTYYTGVERNAILDRTLKEGLGFIMVIPMKPGEKPDWYPDTYIYADRFNSTIEQLAKYIEFKVTTEGGIVKPLTLEEQHQNLIDKIKEKKNIINLQHSSTAIEIVINELPRFKKCFNDKCEFLRNNIFDQLSYYPFNYAIRKAHIGYGEYLLECEFILPGMIYDGIKTTQDVIVSLDLSKIYGDISTKKSLESEQRIFYYTPEFQGWALPHLHEQATNKELQVLFRNRYSQQYYDLVNPIRTEKLIDAWFQKLLSYSSKEIERYV